MIAVVARSAEGADFRLLSEVRKFVVAMFGWCSICGTPFREDELRWTLLGVSERSAERDGQWHAEAPFHEVCGLYAAQVCPWMLSPRGRSVEARPGQRRDPIMTFGAFKRLAAVSTGTLKHAEGAGYASNMLQFHTTGFVDSVSFEFGRDLEQRYRELLRTEPELHLSASERALAQRFAERDELAHDVVEAAELVGGAGDRDALEAVLPGGADDTVVADLKRMLPSLALHLLDHPDRQASYSVGKPMVAHAFAWAAAVGEANLPPALQRGRDLLRAIGFLQAKAMRSPTASPRTPEDPAAVAARHMARRAKAKKGRKASSRARRSPR